MTRQSIGWLVATATLIAILGSLALTPQFQLWQWTQRYDTVAEAQERLKTDPNDVKAHRTLAWQLFENSRTPVKQSRHEWEEVLRCDPSDQFAVVIIAPTLMEGTRQDKERAKRLLTPIAAHGNVTLRGEARHMLQDIGAPVP